jgi:hypothetical protein
MSLVYNDDDDFDEMLAVYYHVSSVAMMMIEESDASQSIINVSQQINGPRDHRSNPRGRRRIFRHDEALLCIKRDYLGPHPLLDAEFKQIFRISRGRFQLMMEDVAATGIEFYLSKKNRNNQSCASIEAKLLLPLKCLAYGVPTHCFMDYFSMSKTLCAEAARQFDNENSRLHRAILRHIVENNSRNI